MRVSVSVLLFLSGCIGLTPTNGEKDSAAGDSSGTVPTGPFTVDPGSVDFGTIAVGGTAEQPLVVTNTSDGLLRLVADIDGDGAFTLTESSVAIAPDEDAVLTVQFEAGASQLYTGDLALVSADDDTVIVPLSGAGDGATTGPTDTGSGTDTGTPVEGAPNLTVSPGSYDFSQVDLGNVGTTTFTLRNTGDEDLLVSDLRFSDPAFAVTSSTMSLPQIIHPSGSESATVAFSPAAIRTYNGTLSVTSDDPDGAVVVALTGEGADLCGVCSGLISVDTGGDPYTIDSFVSVLGFPSSVNVTVTNVGDMDLAVSDVYVNNDTLATCGTFSVSGWRGAATLTPGGSSRFTVDYRASSVCLEVPLTALDQNVLHILSDDPSQGDYVVELSGVGING
jgi:hypothetical protein